MALQSSAVPLGTPMEPIERHVTDGRHLHPLRASDLTSSDLGAVRGIDPFKTPLQVYGEKTGQLAEARALRVPQRPHERLLARADRVRDDRDVVVVEDAEAHLGGEPSLLLPRGHQRVTQSLGGTYAENKNVSYEAIYFGTSTDNSLLGGLLGVVLEILHIDVNSVTNSVGFDVRHFSGYLVSTGRMGDSEFGN